MAMACGRSSSVRSLSTLFRKAVAIRCSSSSSSSSGSLCSSDSSSATISSTPDVGFFQGNNSSDLRASGSNTGAPLPAGLTGLGGSVPFRFCTGIYAACL